MQLQQLIKEHYCMCHWISQLLSRKAMLKALSTKPAAYPLNLFSTKQHAQLSLKQKVNYVEECKTECKTRYNPQIAVVLE